jgi:hypothetical protein
VSAVPPTRPQRHPSEDDQEHEEGRPGHPDGGAETQDQDREDRAAARVGGASAGHPEQVAPEQEEEDAVNHEQTRERRAVREDAQRPAGRGLGPERCRPGQPPEHDEAPEGDGEGETDRLVGEDGPAVEVSRDGGGEQ